MSCLSVTLTRAGGISASSEHVPSGMSAGLVRTGGIAASHERVDEWITATVVKTGFAADLARVCTTSIRNPYLEIEPELIWVYPDWAVDNDVLSNTYWHIN